MKTPCREFTTRINNIHPGQLVRIAAKLNGLGYTYDTKCSDPGKNLTSNVYGEFWFTDHPFSDDPHPSPEELLAKPDEWFFSNEDDNKPECNQTNDFALDAANAKIEMLEERLDEARRELSEERELGVAIMGALDAWHQKCREQMERVQRCDCLLRDEVIRGDGLERANAKLNDDISLLNARLKDADACNTNVMKQNAFLTKNLDDLQQDNADLKARLDQFRRNARTGLRKHGGYLVGDKHFAVYVEDGLFDELGKAEAP